MRICTRCGQPMEENLQLNMSITTVGTSMSGDGGISVGSGEGELGLAREVDGKSLFGKPVKRWQQVGTLRGALCKTCGEVSIYLPGGQDTRGGTK